MEERARLLAEAEASGLWLQMVLEGKSKGDGRLPADDDLAAWWRFVWGNRSYSPSNSCVRNIQLALKNISDKRRDGTAAASVERDAAVLRYNLFENAMEMVCETKSTIFLFCFFF